MDSPSNNVSPPTSLLNTPADREVASTTASAYSAGFHIPPGSIGAILYSQALHGEFLPGLKYGATDIVKNTAMMDEIHLQLKERAAHPYIPDGSMGAILRCQASHGEFLPGLEYCGKDYQKNTVMMNDVYGMIQQRAIHGDPPGVAQRPSQGATNIFAQRVNNRFARVDTNLFGQRTTDLPTRGTTNLFAQGATQPLAKEASDVSSHGATNIFAQGATNVFAPGASDISAGGSTNHFAQEFTTLFGPILTRPASFQQQTQPIERSESEKLSHGNSVFGGTEPTYNRESVFPDTPKTQGLVTTSLLNGIDKAKIQGGLYGILEYLPFPFHTRFA